MEYWALAEPVPNARQMVKHAELPQRLWRLTHASGASQVRTLVKNPRSNLRDNAENLTYIFREPRTGCGFERRGIREKTAP